MSEVMSTSEAARRLGVGVWAVRRVYEKKLLPDAPRIGQNRLIRGDDLPHLEAALRKAGYLKTNPDRPEGGAA
jgi:hypothetical protein